MKDLPPDPIPLKKRRLSTAESTVEDLASMLIRRLPPPPASDAATLARVATRLQTAIERQPRRRPRRSVLLIAAAVALALSVATAALRQAPSTPTVGNEAHETPKTTIDERTPSLSLDLPAIPAIPAPATDEGERATPIPMRNGASAHRARPEGSTGRSTPEPTPDGPEVAEALWLGRALRRLRTEHDPNGALRLLDGYEARFPARTLAAEVLLARVEAQLALGNRAEALRLIEAEGRGTTKESRQIVLIHGELRAGAGRCAEALADFDRILAQPGTDAITERALYGRAVCYRRLQQVTAAERDFGAYLRRFPSGRFASSARAAVGGP